jgi:hypothetical protein
MVTLGVAWQSGDKAKAVTAKTKQSGNNFRFIRNYPVNVRAVDI